MNFIYELEWMSIIYLPELMNITYKLKFVGKRFQLSTTYYCRDNGSFLCIYHASSIDKLFTSTLLTIFFRE